MKTNDVFTIKKVSLSEVGLGNQFILPRGVDLDIYICKDSSPFVDIFWCYKSNSSKYKLVQFPGYYKVFILKFNHND